MKRILLVIVSMIVCVSIYAENTDSISSNTSHKVTGTVAADVVSRYIWRGLPAGDAAVQPSASLSWRGLCIGAWASFGFVKTSDPREFDFTLSYATHGFNVGITDYWFCNAGENNQYFAYRDGETAYHVFEGNIGYDFGFMNLQWFTNFAGNDYLESGSHAYSSYFQLCVPFKLVTCDWNATVGVSPYKSPMYGNEKFACTYVALRCTKPIHVYRKFYIPIFGEISANPQRQKAYFLAGFTIAPWG